MSYFAKSKCPFCGKEKFFHLGGLAWATQMKPIYTGECVTTCDYCQREYDPQKHCISMTKDN